MGKYGTEMLRAAHSFYMTWHEELQRSSCQHCCLSRAGLCYSPTSSATKGAVLINTLPCPCCEQRTWSPLPVAINDPCKRPCLARCNHIIQVAEDSDLRRSLTSAYAHLLETELYSFP